MESGAWSGTLRQLLSTGVSRWSLFAGKFIGLYLIGIVLPTALCVLLGLSLLIGMVTMCSCVSGFGGRVCTVLWFFCGLNTRRFGFRGSLGLHLSDLFFVGGFF